MNFKEILLFALLLVGSTFVGSFLSSKVLDNSISFPQLGAVEPNRFQTVGTDSSVSVGVASTEVLSANTGRQWARITNDDSSNAIYLSLGSAATVNSGIKIAAGGTFEINPDNLYIGAINGITSSTSTVVVVEK